MHGSEEKGQLRPPGSAPGKLSATTSVGVVEQKGSGSSSDPILVRLWHALEKVVWQHETNPVIPCKHKYSTIVTTPTNFAFQRKL